MPFCTRCGEEVPVGSSYCPSCGCNLQNSIQYPISPQLQIPNPSPQARHRTRTVVGLIAVSLFVVAVVIFASALWQTTNPWQAKFDSIVDQSNQTSIQNLNDMKMWQNGTMTANQYGNATAPLIQQLMSLENETQDPNIPASWSTAFGDYGAALGNQIDAMRISTQAVHQPDPKNSPLWSLATDDLNQATQDIQLAQQAEP